MHRPTTQPLDRTFFEGSTAAVAQRLLGKLLVRRLSNGQRLSGIIVEVEAYVSEGDPACHSHRGPTPRNASMFLSAGTLYVYSIHTRYCLNVVTEAAGRGSAVLIRALQPLEGLEAMALLRGVEVPDELASDPSENGPSHSRRTAWLRSLTTGPGRLCQALAVDRLHDGLELPQADTIWVEAAPTYLRPVRKQVTDLLSPHPTLSPAMLAARGRKKGIGTGNLSAHGSLDDALWKIVSSPRIGISRAQTLPLRWFIDGHQLVSGCARDHSQGRHWRFAMD